MRYKLPVFSCVQDGRLMFAGAICVADMILLAQPPPREISLPRTRVYRCFPLRSRKSLTPYRKQTKRIIILNRSSGFGVCCITSLKPISSITLFPIQYSRCVFSQEGGRHRHKNDGLRATCFALQITAHLLRGQSGSLGDVKIEEYQLIPFRNIAISTGIVLYVVA